ncbi:Protein-lysine N-methyltransferase efm6 [Marasmius crinis-equi]|uniref:Protein-lysine N-methyltransferase EFM6 n=1 Tax=Marasmius crinis-equi TaxID=585013 RepID=A0ABR3FZE3_9AGAR
MSALASDVGLPSEIAWMITAAKGKGPKKEVADADEEDAVEDEEDVEDVDAEDAVRVSCSSSSVRSLSLDGLDFPRGPFTRTEVLEAIDVEEKMVVMVGNGGICGLAIIKHNFVLYLLPSMAQQLDEPKLSSDDLTVDQHFLIDLEDEEQFQLLRLTIGIENAGTSNLLQSELVSMLPGQCYSLHDKTLTLTFSQNLADKDHDSSTRNLSITLGVDSSPGCGGVVWPAGQILSSYLVRKGPAYLQGKNVLELGSGTGLVGLIAAMLNPAHVWITDQVFLLDMMRQNVSKNNLDSKCTVAELDWGTPIPTAIARPDVILAADCVYFEPAFPLLVQTLCDLVSDNTEVLLCYKKRRKADKRFFALLKKRFVWAQVEDDPNRPIYERDSIALLRISKRKTRGAGMT